MTKKTAPKRKTTPPQQLITDTAARDALKVEERDIIHDRVTELADLLWQHESMDNTEINVRVVRAIEHFNSLEPSDGAESMLAQQMVGTHFAALECLRRAALPKQTFEGRDMALKHAHKLMTLYARQLETLNKNRGKGQQKVTVEHVHVAAGGQAIVGNVEAGHRANEETGDRAIDHKPDVPSDLAATPKTARKC
jgi:hypothetical protein